MANAVKRLFHYDFQDQVQGLKIQSIVDAFYLLCCLFVHVLSLFFSLCINIGIVIAC